MWVGGPVGDLVSVGRVWGVGGDVLHNDDDDTTYITPQGRRGWLGLKTLTFQFHETQEFLPLPVPSLVCFTALLYDTYCHLICTDCRAISRNGPFQFYSIYSK